VIVVTVLWAFLAGMTLGGLFTGSTSEPTRVAANIVPPHPGGHTVDHAVEARVRNDT
jgi:hypothetical protein